ncbi:uncharacterized protein N7496_002088 [Penicillium cataractarum]|uniref:Chitin deacetylase n=1 Tax=Penicillium cataractarum TaxID=2100454 RepID=A0A9W9VHI2_9EURO|nr:uncharacterized protein N7496_002088 [Penicillium cataractarum]KAJ5379660.1 hypothetical protein N7496_002088 [Penicillium cataractarum]
MYVRLIAAVLVSVISTYAHAVDEDWNTNASDPLDWSSAGSKKPLGHGVLETRSTTTCGPSANNAVCASNLCCGPNGVCGTGSYYCAAPSCLFQYGPACDANQTPTGVNTTSVPRPKLGSTQYGVSIRDCGIPGKVALTFDDGPYIYTSALLDILKEKGVKATFFLVGNNGGKGQINDPKTGYPALIQRMYNEGHQVGSHTWSHADLSTLTRQQRYDQVVKNEIALTDILGFFPTYLRPPYESCNADCLNDLKDLGYHVANYDIDTLDWQGDYTRSQSIFSSNLKSASPSARGFISLAHDIHDKTVHIFAAYMIDTLLAAGYTTALYGECMNDPPANWYRNSTTGEPYTGASHNTSTASNAKSVSVSSNSTTTSITHSSTTATPSAVVGGEGAFGSRTGNATVSGTNGTASGTNGTATKSQATSGMGLKSSETAGTFFGMGLTWAILSWLFWI